jgi:SNF2 family DNA or RNA helicase
LAWQKIRREQPGFEPSDDRAQQQLFEPAQDGAPRIDFATPSNIIRAVAEGERLSFGHLFNPAFAAETSLIDPLPHQRIAVYQHMLNQPRLRFLLADDAGAGKTIMTGLYVREMLARRLIRRVLIVPPAGLVGNWERELRLLFNLSFTVIAGNDARESNPFEGPASNHIILSIDTLAGERMFRRLQEKTAKPYDLVVFDEAHKLSAMREPDMRMRKTDRYRLAEVLVGIQSDDPRWQLDWSCQHLLLLTATPHMGKDFPYYALWRLLEPEILSTYDAFSTFDSNARSRYFLRRTKEEMVRFDGTPIYPKRISDTLSYDLTHGDVSEQKLYDETTTYIRTYYNRARILNRAAARLAMSVFQRRLASSTYALMRSFERRIAKLDGFIEDLQSGRMDIEALTAAQIRLGQVHDAFEDMTADDEEPTVEGTEENELDEEKALGGVVAVSLAELETERLQVRELLSLSREVYGAGHESKFERLQAVLRDPQFRNEKFIVFTEHRDTLTFLVRRLEGLGFTGSVAQIHGGMNYRQRDAEVERFRKSAEDGGAQYLIATDAAGEGINLQFCWLMVNYDIPWNPARLEQRMGRIHRYKQTHDPVIIVNLVAGKTREGRVLKTLLEKLERIRKELNSDKVFDVVGRLFDGVSLKEYLVQAVTEDGAIAAERQIEGTLTKEQVEAINERERRLFGDGGDVLRQLPTLKEDIEREQFRRLLPGYVRRFLTESAPLLDLAIEGDLENRFVFRALKSGALDPILPILDFYAPTQNRSFTLNRPADSSTAIWLHPGEPVFEEFRNYICTKFEKSALRGGVFVDPTATAPYIFHLALVSAVRKADRSIDGLTDDEVVEVRLVGLRQQDGGEIEECPVEYLLLLKGAQAVPLDFRRIADTADASRELSKSALDRIAHEMAARHRDELLTGLPVREAFVKRGFDYQDAELAARRARYTDRARTGDPKAKAELTRVRDRQRALLTHRDRALSALRAEPELISPSEVHFITHALVVPSADPEDRKRHDEEIEALAVRLAWAYEEAFGAKVKDVSKPLLALQAGLMARPGFDLLSLRPEKHELAIEVKGRAGIGDVELTENEWAKACNLRERYWLYVAFNCGTHQPRLVRVKDPFGKLLVQERGGVIISEQEIFAAAAREEVR